VLQLFCVERLHPDQMSPIDRDALSAVIVVDVDDETTGSERGRARLFTALTRATVRLDVLIKNGDRIADDLSAAALR
jgi:hypothetical protein